MVDLSIIIPMYNSSCTIGRTIQSILNQTIQVKEIIVVNDGSRDDSEEVVKAINDQRIVLLSQKNGGTSSAKNNGIRHACGKYIMFIDSDDVIEKEYVEKHFERISDCDLVCSGMKVVYPLRDNTVIVNSDSEETNKIVDINKLLYLLESGELINVDVAKVFKRDVLIDHKIFFDERLNAGEDLKFNCDYFRHIENGILLSYSGYNYIRLENGSLVSSYKSEIALIVQEVIRSRRELYDYFNLWNDLYFQKRFNDTTMNAYISEIPNCYRKNCPLNANEKREMLKKIKKEVKGFSFTHFTTKQDEVMYKILVSLNTALSNIVFTLLFSLKDKFHFLYRRMFHV